MVRAYIDTSLFVSFPVSFDGVDDTLIRWISLSFTMYLFPLDLFWSLFARIRRCLFRFPEHRHTPTGVSFHVPPFPLCPYSHCPYCCHPKRLFWVDLSIICRTMLFTLVYRWVAHLFCVFVGYTRVVSSRVGHNVASFVSSPSPRRVSPPPPSPLHAPATFHIVCDCGSCGVSSGHFCSCRCVCLGYFVCVCC